MKTALTCLNTNEMEISSAFFCESNSNFWIVMSVLYELSLEKVGLNNLIFSPVRKLDTIWLNQSDAKAKMGKVQF